MSLFSSSYTFMAAETDNGGWDDSFSRLLTYGSVHPQLYEATSHQLNSFVHFIHCILIICTTVELLHALFILFRVLFLDCTSVRCWLFFNESQRSGSSISLFGTYHFSILTHFMVKRFYWKYFEIFRTGWAKSMMLIDVLIIFCVWKTAQSLENTPNSFIRKIIVSQWTFRFQYRFFSFHFVKSKESNFVHRLLALVKGTSPIGALPNEDIFNVPGEIGEAIYGVPLIFTAILLLVTKRIYVYICVCVISAVCLRNQLSIIDFASATTFGLCLLKTRKF